MNNHIPIQFDGWNLSYSMSTDGLILHDIMHDGHFFAQDARIVQLCIGTLDANNLDSRVKLKSFKIGTPWLMVSKDSPKIIEAPTAPQEFPYFPPIGGISADYETTQPVFLSFDGKWTFSQKYLFTGYGSEPSHEPLAITRVAEWVTTRLEAARFLPLFYFKYESTDNETISPAYLRVDYRLSLSLNTSLKKGFHSNQSKRNQAGVFRDKNFPTFIPGIDLLRPDTHDIFAAAEKPLKYEIIGYGLDHGKASNWDNIHWWGKDPDGKLPSTPGAYHAAHLHWRWARIVGFDEVLSESSAPFKGPGGPGTPLIDPMLSDQSLTFAIVKKDDKRLISDEVSKSRRFEEIFTREKRVPYKIDKGEEIVLWMSFEIFRNTSGPWSGVIFPQGMYFAHNSEPWFSIVEDAREPLEKPRARRTWVRP